MSSISRLKNTRLQGLGLNEWGEREAIPTDVNAEMVEGSQYFPDGRIPSSKIRDLRVNTITFDTDGYLRGGQTAYDTGIGFWMGYDTSAYKLSIGNSAGNKLTWDGTTLSITGTLTATAGAIGGFDIGADYIRDTANSFGLASTVTGSDDIRFWAGDTFANRTAAPFRITEAGAVTATSITITGGSITGVPISSIPNNSSTDISLLDMTHDLVFSVTDRDTVAWATGTITMSNGRTFSISSGNTGNMTLRTYIYLDTAVSSTVLQATTTVSTAMGANKKLIAVAQNGVAQPTYTVYGGIGGLKLGTANTSVSNNNWTYSGTWSITDADTIAWGSGTLTTSDGGSYSITGSNTGNMAAKTYVYFDLGTSATAFQVTTTAATAIGEGKILIAICQNTAGTEAVYTVMNDRQSNIDAASIAAGSITANEISAGAITAIKINVSQLSAITADMGAITAGTITFTAAGHLKGGQTAYNNGTGFFLGYESAAYKFSVGNATNYLTWDGTQLEATGVSLIDAPITNLMTAGEDITVTTPIPVYINNSNYIPSVDQSHTTASDLVNNIYDVNWTGQTFTLSADINTLHSIVLNIVRVGTVSGNVTISIRATSAGLPTGADLGSCVIAGSSISTSLANVTFVFSSPITVTPSTKYAVIVSAPGGTSSGNCINVWGDASSPSYTDGSIVISSNSGSTWAADTAYDMYFQVYGYYAYTAGTILQADDTDPNKVAYAGMILDTVTTGNTVRTQFNGIVDGYSGLSTGSVYYLDVGEAQKIGTSPGDKTVIVGIAVSTTKLLLADATILGSLERTEVDVGNSGTAATIDWSISSKEKITLTANTTLTFIEPNEPSHIVLKVLQDNTGSRTITWPAAVEWSGGTAPTLTVTGNRADIIFFYFDGTSYFGTYSLNYTP